MGAFGRRALTSYDLATIKNKNLTLRFVHVIYNGPDEDPTPEDLYVVAEIGNFGLNRLAKDVEERISHAFPSSKRIVERLGILQLREVKARLDNPEEVLPPSVESGFDRALALIVTAHFNILS